jgi:uncharacterized coiled-coil protein SlyX
VSFERFDDGDHGEASSGRPLLAAPGLDRSTEARGHRVEVAAENRARDWVTRETAPESGERDRAIAELAAENADLYRRNADLYQRNAEQAKTIERLQARLDLAEARVDRTEDRFRVWAKEMANREDARAARDEARDKREEALIGRVNELEHIVTERSDGLGERRMGATASFEGERAVHKGKVRLPSNEAFGFVSSVSAEALTAAGDIFGSTTAEVGGLVAGAVGIFAATLPWTRMRREERHVDRS